MSWKIPKSDGAAGPSGHECYLFLLETVSALTNLMQITIRLTFVYLLHEYKAMKRTALLLTEFY